MLNLTFTPSCFVFFYLLLVVFFIYHFVPTHLRRKDRSQSLYGFGAKTSLDLLRRSKSKWNCTESTGVPKRGSENCGTSQAPMEDRSEGLIWNSKWLAAFLRFVQCCSPVVFPLTTAAALGVLSYGLVCSYCSRWRCRQRQKEAKRLNMGKETRRRPFTLVKWKASRV